MNGATDFDKKHQETFRHKFSTANGPENYKIEVHIDIPFEGNISEFGHRIINGFCLPLNLIEGNLFLCNFCVTSVLYIDCKNLLVSRTLR